MRVREETTELSLRELMFSDLARHRSVDKPTWPRVIARCVTTPGMLGSMIVRVQECLYRSGRVRLAGWLRMVGLVLLSADFGPGMTVGPGLLLAHPAGVVMGFGARIGSNVSIAGGATIAARYYDGSGPQTFATIGNGVTIGAHAVLVGGVEIGDNSVIGANTVVLSDVAPNTIVFGVPARPIGKRDPIHSDRSDGQR